MIGICIAAVIVLFLAVLLIRAAMFKPKDQAYPDLPRAEADVEKATEHLQQMIRCKTISSRDPALAMPEEEFEKFRQLLVTLYPNVTKAATLERIGPAGVLYHIPGKKQDAPCVFMSHYDVVPVEEEAWEKPAFEGILEGDILWGRGTLDTKTTLLGVMEATESLLSQGFVPENDLYLAFAGDEEIGGESQPAIVAELKRRGIVPALVVDEAALWWIMYFPASRPPAPSSGRRKRAIPTLRFPFSAAAATPLRPLPIHR